MFRRHKLSEAQLYEALKQVPYPGDTRDLVSVGGVKSVNLQGNSVSVVLELLPQRSQAMPAVRQAAEAALRALPGIGTVQVEIRLASTTSSRSSPTAPGFSRAGNGHSRDTAHRCRGERQRRSGEKHGCYEPGRSAGHGRTAHWLTRC